MRRLWNSVSYVLWIVMEIVKGSLQLARAVYSPGTRSSPAIIEYPLRATTDVEIIAMASSITITPGTLVVGIAHGTPEERSSLFVHVLFARSREQVMADLREMEDRLLRATRGPGGDEIAPPVRRRLTDERFVDARSARRAHERRRDTRPGHPTTPEEER